MPATSHDNLVVSQYDSRAAAYLRSPVHASGPDLGWIAERVGHRPEASALDVGCGGGHLSFLLAGLVGHVVACDLSRPMLQTVAAEAGRRGLGNIAVREMAAEDLAFAPASFDVVTTRYSAHHWRHWQSGLLAMRRVLKPQGLAVFADVVAPEDALSDTWLQSLELLRDPSHVRNASLPAWKEGLASSGFAVLEVARFRLRLEFASWIERMRTSPVHAAAIRSLQQLASAEVAEYFALEEDGSFSIDTAVILARPI
jgi:ubiquinone/menaquinone biosynthesis C-methylase UbiE